MEQRLAQQLPRSDPVLEAFDRLRLKRVEAEFNQTASAFLAKFQSIAASLQPDERIKIEVVSMHESVKLLKAVLADPQASKVRLGRHSTFDFVSSVLEHPSNKIKVLEMSGYLEGDFARFFAALGQSHVSALTLNHSPKSVQGLHEYLAKDLLVRLDVWMGNKQVPSEMVVSLADCTRLTKLEMSRCEFSQPTAFTHLPKSITKLTLDSCTFVGDFDWSFLADSNVRELDFRGVKEVDGNQLGSALAVHLRAKGLDTLRFVYCNFVDETLAAIGLGVGRIKKLSVSYAILNDASVELIALALQSPNSEMKELVLRYDGNRARSIEDHLVPALKHPNCNLAKLSLWASQEHVETAQRVEDMFHNRLALFALLQGRQAKRRYCPLRRLPVEMFRLVGMVLL
ncbi:hypothetical protein BASA81_015288 [Batrachochytrium salamandrivorans]|nr:hypothetical protein BASA81_015288 [Batrachochytrium salamandrivorans]